MNNNHASKQPVRYRTKHPLYWTWMMMKQRCNNPTSTSFKWYGGRGIKVCQRWQDSLCDFAADMGEKPDPTLTLDRIDNQGDYEPGNCRWADRLTQNHNRPVQGPTGPRQLYWHQGQEKTLAAWAREHGIAPKTLRARVNKGQSIEEALSTPIRSYKRH